uniref:Uncharacterized protein n=1 Tax=Arion vulgaris TaxID=1028688 RepID=A0A0B7BGS8_9EUPU
MARSLSTEMATHLLRSLENPGVSGKNAPVNRTDRLRFKPMTFGAHFSRLSLSHSDPLKGKMIDFIAPGFPV